MKRELDFNKGKDLCLKDKFELWLVQIAVAHTQQGSRGARLAKVSKPPIQKGKHLKAESLIFNHFLKDGV